MHGDLRQKFESDQIIRWRNLHQWGMEYGEMGYYFNNLGKSTPQKSGAVGLSTLRGSLLPSLLQPRSFTKSFSKFSIQNYTSLI